MDTSPRPIIATLFFCLVLVSSSESRADLAHGFVDLGEGGFDFTKQVQDPLWNPERDISWCVIVDPPLGDTLCLWNNAGILAVPDTTLENISYAPPDISSYEFDAVPVEGQSYVLKTGDNFYVKFAVREFQPYGSLVIEYYVQIDGTNNPRDDIIVAVQPTTWGRVKSLYR